MPLRRTKFPKMELLLLLLLTGATSAVEVHFENKDSGFFLKHTARWSGAGPPPEPVAVAPPGSLLSLDRFTVLQAAQPASVRATYGPFSTKQTVPARYSVPDPLDPPPLPRGPRNATLLDLQEVSTHRLDVSAHVVFRELARDSPVLRVLFHAGSEAGARRGTTARAHRVCISLHAALGPRTLSVSCGPEGEEGACLAELTVPANWWPVDGKGKRPPRAVKLSYSATEVGEGAEGEACGRVSVQPAWALGAVTLVGSRAGYREVRVGDGALLVPRAPLYPRSKLHLPFVVRRDPLRPVAHIIIKMRVKSGLRLLGATATNSRWSVTAEVKARVATVTATKLEPPPKANDENNESIDEDSGPGSGWEEVLVWLVEVSGEGEAAEGSEGGRGAARLVWSARLAPAAAPLTATPSSQHDHPRTTTRLDVEKDDIQAVLPISKNWEVLNTAVLTGRQVSQAMKVLIVSQAGQVADITLQSSCHSEDESVLKVSSSCSSVYVDGSEIRGSSNASVIVKYGTYTGLARFTVWMPDNRLEVDVDDTRLSQIKGWRVSEESGGGKERLKRSYAARGWSGAATRSDHTNSLSETRACRLRYQQSPVEVFARFLATDHDSGRVSYFVSRRTWMKVTDLVISLMRVSDPIIASLHGRILQGRSTGRTEVQVLSPITGRVIGSREVRVVNDKVTLSRLLVRVISGLQLNIAPDSEIDNGYISETTVTRRLTAQYQEGLLDIDIEFSDGSKTPLRDVSVSDYYLLVESLDPEVVAFAPMVASHHPRVIAVGEGTGELLRVTLLTSEECRSGPLRRAPLPAKGDTKTPANIKSVVGALATAAASVDVDFSAADIPQRPDTPQNDDIMARGGMRSGLSDMSDILLGFPPFKDENNHEPTVQARQHGSVRNHGGRSHHQSPHMTPVEIGMYVLLGAFCFAIVIFVVSCVVYASKFKPAGHEPVGVIGSSMPMQSVNAENGKIQVAGLVGTTLGFGRDKTPRESTTNAHDWVWLGRATIERNSHHPANRNSTQSVENGNISNEMRITNNPLNYNYADPDDAIKAENGNVMVTSFDNPNSIELPSQVVEQNGNKKVIDSTTYCKKPNRHSRQHSGENSRQWQVDTGSQQEYRPPVPPHRNPQPFIPAPPRNPPRILADTVMPPPIRRSHHAKSHHKRHDRDAPSGLSDSPENKRGVQRVIDLNKAESPFPKFDDELSKNEADSSTSKDNKLMENVVEKLTNKDDCSGMFEFDKDAPIILENKDYKEVISTNRGMDDSKRTFTKPQSPDYMRDSGIGIPEVQMRHKNRSKENNNRGFIAPDDFIEAAKQNNGGISPEVKRATIVGNPMCSMRPKVKHSAPEQAAPDDVPTESLGLDDLEMDYDQIMHYFHNLKESNA